MILDYLIAEVDWNEVNILEDDFGMADTPTIPGSQTAQTGTLEVLQPGTDATQR